MELFEIIISAFVAAQGGGALYFLHKNFKQKRTPTPPQVISVQGAKFAEKRITLCKSVTFFVKDNTGKVIERRVFHTNQACPDFNSTRDRDKLMREHQGLKYSFNTHRIEPAAVEE